MKIHRFIRSFNFDKKISSISDKEIFNQIKNVLRLRAGEKIILGDGKGNEAMAEITGFEKHAVQINILKMESNQAEPEMRVILYLSVLKKENFELAVQKAVEAGVAEIIPIITERTVKTNLRADRLEKIIREASEQSGRGIVPALGKTMNLREAITHAGKNDLNLFFDLGGKKFEQRLIAVNWGTRAGIFIGPEGGWDEAETKTAEEKNFQIASLGRLTLRAETAAIIATYLVASAKN